MTYVCLWSPRWATVGAPLAELAAPLLEVAPRVAVEGRGVIWADGRGLPSARLAWSLLAALGQPHGGEVRAGVGAVPVAAELAARSGDAPVTVVEPGRERAFVAPLGLDLLEPDPRLRALLRGVGIERCGALAELSREAVEIRFGAEGGRLWRLARADDSRLLFRPIPRERASASMEFVDHAVRDGGRLIFIANALLGSVCGALAERGERAREMALLLSLSDRSQAREVVRVARATADRGRWLRRIQEVLDRLRLPDTVTGIELRVESTEAASAVQGDMFDRGFATAAPAEEAVARLVDAHGPLLVEPDTDSHPLAERRTHWRPRSPAAAVRTEPPSPSSPPPSPAPLSLQLLREPRRVAVRVRLRRGHAVPARFCDLLDDGRWHALVTVAGPDRVSGGRWEEGAYAREYYRCVTDTGALVWLFRDAREGHWYLHGWWD